MNTSCKPIQYEVQFKHVNDSWSENVHGENQVPCYTCLIFKCSLWQNRINVSREMKDNARKLLLIISPLPQTYQVPYLRAVKIRLIHTLLSEHIFLYLHETPAKCLIHITYENHKALNYRGPLNGSQNLLACAVSILILSLKWTGLSYFQQK